MANDEPERYLLNMSKKAAQGKDLSRLSAQRPHGDRRRRAVARAREGATVSMPLTWTQVHADLDPKRYTVRTVPALLAKTKAWHDYDEAAAPIKAAMKKLASKLKRQAHRLRQSSSCPGLVPAHPRLHRRTVGTDARCAGTSPAMTRKFDRG